MRALLAGLAGLAALVLVGCGTSAQAPQAGPPKYVPASCPAPGPTPSDRPGVTVLGPFGGGEGAIPAGFQLAWVLACPIEQRYVPGQGLWQTQVTERADLTTSQADALLAVLRASSDASNDDQMCTAQLTVGPYYALVDRHGTAIQPALPTGLCGAIKPEVTKALGALPYRELSVRPEAPVK